MLSEILPVIYIKNRRIGNDVNSAEGPAVVAPKPSTRSLLNNQPRAEESYRADSPPEQLSRKKASVLYASWRIMNWDHLCSSQPEVKGFVSLPQILTALTNDHEVIKRAHDIAAGPLLMTSEFRLSVEAESYWTVMTGEYGGLFWTLGSTSSIHYKRCRNETQTLIDVIVVARGPLMQLARVPHRRPLGFQSNPIYGKNHLLPIDYKKRVSIWAGPAQQQMRFAHERGNGLWQNVLTT